MPELPEVEIHRERLNRACRGLTLRRLDIIDNTRFEGSPTEIEGATILRWRRRAKYLIADLSSGWSLLSHLGMTGQWLVNPQGQRSHQRISLIFEGSTTIVLIDPRRFGWTWIVPTESLEDHPRLKSLALEPDDRRMTPDYLHTALGKSRASIHSRFLAQTAVVGLGNIAVSEICWRARVHPLTPCARLGEDAWQRVHDAIGAHIAFVLRVENPDEIVYLSSSGGENPFYCYGRQAEPCPRCSEPLLRDRSGGRSVFFCPSCQAMD